MDYSIRPATSIDEAFVWQEHLKANRSYMERHMGASVEDARRYFNENFPKQECYMIESNGSVIGCYCINDYPDKVKLSRFFLIEEAQGKGIGTKITSELLGRYTSIGKSIFIHVWTDNPVQDFWKRLGFVYESTGEDNLMQFVYTRI